MSYQRWGEPGKARECFVRADISAKAATELSAGHRRELAAFRAEAEPGFRQLDPKLP